MSSNYEQQLVQARHRAASGMKEIYLSAERAARELTKDERRSLDSLDEQYDRATAEIARIASVHAMQTPEDRALFAGLEASRTSAGSMDYELRGMIGDAFQGRYSGFGSSYSTGQLNSWASATSLEYRALQSAGGSAISSTFADQVIAYQRTLSPMLDPSIVRTVARTNGAPYIQPRLTADAAAGGTVTAEAGGITLLDPTISAVTITPTKRAAITKISSELFEDNDIDLQALVVETTSRAIGIALGTATTATLVAGITNGGTAAGTALGAASWTFFGPPDLATLYVSVAAPYRSTGTWIVSNDALAKLYQLRDSQQQPVLFNAAGNNFPTLFGRPVVVDPGLAAVGSASKSVLFGDFHQALTMVRRTPIDVLVSREAYYASDEVGVRVIDRSAGAVIDAVAASYLISANV